ncbi:MAG TPA: CDP-diacylglycerol--glycerol-3-phosphate 3-phosphatidyltransferase [Oscillospiraceae bacterium]|nr:CDP-diacylglycerol--glycerol-3-phosphate 3-phosphatidyltransferase [Oscillospiraceae bacterium]HRW57818.1 CDP-diacylglycerol--glycerol-3-phosphate 3-phosphatidyltransferase [Oscillospiraceae bacterium]
MNLPNKLTMLRMVMVPLFVAAFLLSFDKHFLIALILYAAASVTDILDGNIARYQNLVTDFGKLMDPLADKILVTSALVCFTAEGLISPVVTIIIMSRDLLVTSFRLIGANKGKVIAADVWGKLKTATQDIGVCCILFWQAIAEWNSASPVTEAFHWASEILVVAMTVLTVISGYNYIRRNWDLLMNKN